jgi:predicted homoserine dehydrogenase-like protein
MNRAQAQQVTGYRNGRSWSGLVSGLSLLVALAALATSMRAVDASRTALRQAGRTSKEAIANAASIASQANVAHASLRSGIDTADASAALCHRRVDLVIEAVAAVAKTCPGRWRAPAALGDAQALSPNGGDL